MFKQIIDRIFKREAKEVTTIPAARPAIAETPVTFIGEDGNAHYIYAQFVHPDYGSDFDIMYAKEAGLQFEAFYRVAGARTGRHHCDITLLGSPAVFNSVQFKFFDELSRPVDITQLPQFQTYFEFAGA